MSYKKAFTLIELLVVIAIIAILAAILFPVFAQAKDSAKNTALLNNVKQAGTSQMLYSADYDDILPPTMMSHPTLPIDLGWQDLVQPYMKNYELILNPKRNRPANDAYLYWTRLQHIGMPARAAAAANATVVTQNYYQGTHAGQNVRHEGVGGFGNLGGPGAADWLGRAVATSYSNTQVDDVSNTILLAEGSNWDSWFSVVPGDGVTIDTLRYCIRWIPVQYNANGGSYSSPITTTTRPQSGQNGLTPTCYIPQGRSTVTMTDSSARAVDFRGQIYNPSPSKTAGIYVSRLLNPMGM